MNILIKRRQLILATLVVALGAAVFVNWYYSGDDSNTIQSAEETTESEYVQNLGEAKYVNATGETADYFSEVKLNRQKSHDEALEKLNDSLESAKSGSEEAKSITASIDALTAQIKAESDVEALISAKTGSECVAVISETSAQIVVGAETLTDDAALQIMDIVTTNTKLTASQIKITTADAE